jgi:hypothetical protein
MSQRDNGSQNKQYALSDSRMEKRSHTNSSELLLGTSGLSLPIGGSSTDRISLQQFALPDLRMEKRSQSLQRTSGLSLPIGNSSTDQRSRQQSAKPGSRMQTRSQTRNINSDQGLPQGSLSNDRNNVSGRNSEGYLPGSGALYGALIPDPANSLPGSSMGQSSGSYPTLFSPLRSPMSDLKYNQPGMPIGISQYDPEGALLKKLIKSSEDLRAGRFPTDNDTRGNVSREESCRDKGSREIFSTRQ